MVGLIKRTGSVLALMFAGVALFDVAAYFLFPDIVRRIEPRFAREAGAEMLRESGMKRYYQASETRGFDIIPGARSFDWRPPDIAPYEIWGNSVGCFDDEPPAGVAPDIYLAGDSFTWGFAPYQAKFGTLIEERTGLLVYACGVMNTAQRHQLDKFLEVSGTFPGWPKLVIVNVFLHDHIEDLAFPQSPVADSISVKAQIQEVLPSAPVQQYLKIYSATANIIATVIRNTFNKYQDNYGSKAKLDEEGKYPIWSDAAAPHRRAIKTWIAHAKSHGYQIRFALIPDIKAVGTDVYAEFRAYIQKIGGISWDFEAYIISNKLDPSDLYWPNDGHFNLKGNAAYAEFLMERLRADVRSGLLAARFARFGAPDPGGPATTR